MQISQRTNKIMFFNKPQKKRQEDTKGQKTRMFGEGYYLLYAIWKLHP